MPSSKPEVEVKIAIDTPAAARKLLRSAGFRVHIPRVFEVNVLYDFDGLRLRTQGKILRLREAGKIATLTFKGRSLVTRHKVREEAQTTLANPGAIRRVFQELNLRPVFRYEKYRTEFTRDGPRDNRGVVTLDETPIGSFLEIEGPARWIDRTAKQLGFTHDHYITSSYGALYIQHCADLGITPSNMVFGDQR